MNIYGLLYAVRAWFVDRNLHTADPRNQFIKLVEEMGELASGIARGDLDLIKDSIGDMYVVIIGLALQTELTESIDKYVPGASNHEITLASLATHVSTIGVDLEAEDLEGRELQDVIQDLATIANSYDITLEDALLSAYNEIKDRKGKLIDGVFVKEADLSDKPAEEVPAADAVNHPQHYISESGIESIDVIDAFSAGLTASEGFYFGNVVKYVLRHKKKNGVEDLKKARWYLNRMIGD